MADGRPFFEGLDDQYIAKLWRHVNDHVRKKFGLEPAAAEDVTQTAFMKVHKSSFIPPERFEHEVRLSYLYRSAESVAINQYRGRQTRIRNGCEEVLMNGLSLGGDEEGDLRTADLERVMESRESSPEERLLEKERKKTMAKSVREALEAVSPKWRSVYILREGFDAPYEEIAQTLGIPVGTVMSSLYRARQQLRAGDGEARQASIDKRDIPDGERDAVMADLGVRVAQLQRAYPSINPQYLKAYVLHEEYGLKRSEISSALDIAPGTVGAYVSRAKSKLRGKRLSFAA